MASGFVNRHMSKQPDSHYERIRINNPFKSRSLEEIDKLSEAMASEVDDSAHTREIFRIAGRIAYNPPGWEEAVGSRLSDGERVLLDQERNNGLFRQTKALLFTTLALWLSAIMQGWIQSILNSTNLSWGRQLGVGDAATQPPALHRQAGTNASVYLIAAGTCCLSDPLQSRLLGRRGMLFTAAVFCLAAGVGAACADHWTQLLGCRVLLGIAMGLKASTTSVFAAEISPCHLRGMIVMGWQAGDALGIFLGFTANLVAAKATADWDSSWRWQTASIAIPAICLITLIFTIPDSPRLYLQRGQYQKAYQAMCLLRPIPLQAARDLFYANAQLQVESDHLLKHIEVTGEEKGLLSELDRYQQRVKRLSWWQRIKPLITNPRTRRALQASLIVMVAQQFSGFNVLAFYSYNYFSFRYSSDDPWPPAWLSWGVGLCNFCFTIPAFFLIDRGRVSLLLATYPFMIVIMFASSLIFATAGASVPSEPIIILAFFFTAMYSLGQGPVPFTYSAEVFPLVYRESGMSVAVAANLFFAGLLTLFVPQAQFAGPTSSLDPGRYNRAQARMLGVFVVLEVIAFCLIFLFVPETARCKPSERDALNHMSLEELNAIFEQPTFHHTRWRIQEALPRRVKWTMWRLTPNRDYDDEPVMEMQVHRWESGSDSREKTSQSDGHDMDSRGSSPWQAGDDLTRTRRRNIHSTDYREASSTRGGARRPTVADDYPLMHGGLNADEITPLHDASSTRGETDADSQSVVLHLNDGTTMPDAQRRSHPRPRPNPHRPLRRFY